MGIKKICLVVMPFSSVDNPVLGLSLLKAAALEKGKDARIIYANIRFAKLIGADDYRELEYAASAYMQLIETVFSPYAGYQNAPSQEDAMQHYLNAEFGDIIPPFFSLVQKCDPLIPDFLDQLSDEILAEKPDVVGCTYTFAQCNANLALLKRIKEKSPETITLIGGSSVATEAGQALVDHMDQVDYVFVGESDDIFCDVLDLIAEGRTEELYTRFPYVLHRGGSPATHAVRDLNTLPYPDFDDYFAALSDAGLEEKTDVLLCIEASRGCWWGEKHRCHFCGLHPNPDVLCYRKKDSRRFAEELAYLSEKYHKKTFYLTDCILAREHIKELPPLLEGKGYVLFSEVKTNMTRADIHGLRKAGFVTLQPGIESLNDNLLRLMHKGNRAIKHVQFLKNARTERIRLVWNMMFDLPGEDAKWYYNDIELYPQLFHLCAPQMNRHCYQRQSIFTQHAAEYNVRLKPFDFYPYLFGEELVKDDRFPEFFMADPPQPTPYLSALSKVIQEWRDAYQSGCTLRYRVQCGLLSIFDGRPCACQEIYIFDGLEKEICLIADQAIKANRLLEMCTEPDKAKAEKVLDKLIQKKLILKIDDEVLFLAVPDKIERG